MTLRNKFATILLSLSVILSLAVGGAAQTKATTSSSSKSERTSVREDDNNWNWHHHDGSVDLQVTIRGKVESLQSEVSSLLAFCLDRLRRSCSPSSSTCRPYSRPERTQP